MRRHAALAVMIAVTLAGCPAGVPGGTGTPKSGATRKSAGDPSALGSPKVGLKVKYAPLNEAPRPLELTGKTKLVEVGFVGKAKLISDHGSGIISNNTGGLISDHGSGLVSNNSGSLVSNNSGSLTAKSKLRLAQADAPPESPLADAKIEFLDGAGQVLVDAAGKPLGATTDETGAFKFEGQLPDENLVLRIRLFNGGQLSAILPQGATEIALDTASSLGAAYVLQTYVKNQSTIFAKLPAAEAQALHTDLTAARGLVPASFRSYTVTDLVATTDAVRAKAQPVAERLERIKALLLVGQANLGNGRPATEVALSAPVGLLGLPDGSLLVAESAAGRLRRITPDARVGVYAGGGKFWDGAKLIEASGGYLETPSAMLRLPDGGLLVSDGLTQKVHKLLPDGTIAPYLGSGRRGQTVGRATEAEIAGPRALSLGPDGSVYVGEIPKIGVPGRILRVKPDGMVEVVPGPAVTRAEWAFVEAAADGTLWGGNSRDGSLQRRSPDGTWTLIDPAAGIADFSMAVALANGGLLVASSDLHQLFRYSADGVRTTVAGTGAEGYGGDGGPATAAVLNRPSGIWRAPDGRIVFTDGGNAVVREIALDGTIRTIAGTASSSQVGDATSIAINSPAAIAIDAQGRLLIVEAAGDTVKRLDGNRLTVVAGSGKGLAGDGGPATSAKFNTIAGLAVVGDKLYLGDSINERIRLVDGAGIVTTVVGKVSPGPQIAIMPALASSSGIIMGMAAAPDGTVYWVDNEESQVRRLKGSNVETIAGLVNGEAADAPDALSPAFGSGLNRPVSLSFGPDGALYIADSGNFKIRRITALDTATPMMETFAGNFQKIGTLLGGEVVPDEGSQRLEAMLIGPIAIAFDAAGACYVAEAGTQRLTTLGGIQGISIGNIPRIGARIRRIALDGTVRTVAGPGTNVLNDPGTDDSLITPLGLLFDREGRLVVADSGNNQVKVLPKFNF